MSSPRPPYGEGIYRRRYRLVAGAGCVAAELEDDFHRFRARLDHDGERVLAVHGETLRIPWTTCGGAVEPLDELRGLPLSRRFSDALRPIDPARHCTHLLDLVGLAITHAAGNRKRRVYDVAVPDRRQGATRATLHRDGEPLLAWSVRGQEIEGSPPWAGMSLRAAAFQEWCASQPAPEIAEAAWLLWRGCFISLGRKRDFDSFQVATDFMPVSRLSCHTFTPGIAEGAARIRGTTREFTHDPDALLEEPRAKHA